MVSSTLRPHFTPGKDPVPILQEAGWAPGPGWTGEKSRPQRESIPDRPAVAQSLYRLSYTGTHVILNTLHIGGDYYDEDEGGDDDDDNNNNNITCNKNCKYRTAATLYSVETWFVSGT